MHQYQQTNKQQLKWLVCSSLAGAAALYGFFRLYKYLFGKATREKEISEQHSESESNIMELQDVLPYQLYQHYIRDQSIQQLHSHQPLQYYSHLQNLHYYIILNLQKGNLYQGIVHIQFQNHQPFINQDFIVNFHGNSVRLIHVNGKRIDSKEFIYNQSKIIIPQKFFHWKQGSKNQIEIIFENCYQFVENGLASYFMVDENNKYSLRQQVILTKSDELGIESIIPCINCLNNCSIKLQIMHPQGFQVISNTSKSMERYCSVIQYPHYPFLFESASTLNRSYLNQSFNKSSINYNTFQTTSVNTTASFYQQKRSNTHFHQKKLTSIHHFFLYSSTVVQLKPNSTVEQLKPNAQCSLHQDILIRYFCKQSQRCKVQKGLTLIHCYVIDLVRRLGSQDISKWLSKIDIIIISDERRSGFFTNGVIILDESCFIETVQLNTFYLLARAFYGMILLERQNNIITLIQVIQFNQLFIHKFTQFNHFIFVKNAQYSGIKKLLLSKDTISQTEPFFITYYSHELQFIINHNLETEISTQLYSITKALTNNDVDKFWKDILTYYAVLPLSLLDNLLKIAFLIKKMDYNSAFKIQLRSIFAHSKYILHFYSDNELQEHLSQHLIAETNGLEERLPHLKIKLKYQQFISQKYERYLPILENKTETEELYHRFTAFNQTKNFHSYQVLQQEIFRVKCFKQAQIKELRLNLNNGLMAWKLLTILKIFPSNEKDYSLISFLNPRCS